MFWAISIAWGLFYNGKGKPISLKEGQKFLSKSKLTPIEFDFFGEVRTIDAPVVKEHDGIITNDFRHYLGTMSKSWVLNDKKFRQWTAFLKWREIVNNKWVIWCVTKQAEKNKKKYNEIDLLLLKEFIDGKWSLETYEQEWVEWPISIGHPYEIELPWMKIEIPGMYTPFLRTQAIDISSDFYRKFKTDDFPATLQTWQIDMAKRLWDVTAFAMPRWSWKSYFMGSSAVNDVMWVNLTWDVKSVWFISSDQAALHSSVKAINKYIKSLEHKSAKGEYLFRRGSDDVLKYYLPYKSHWGSIKYRQVWEIVTGLARGNYLTGENLTSVYIDECNKINDVSIYNETVDLVTSRRARLIMWSSVYEHAPKDHWFYNVLTDYEIEYSTKPDINTQIEEFAIKHDIKKLLWDEKNEPDLVGLYRLREEWALDCGNVWIRYSSSEVQRHDNELYRRKSDEKRKRNYRWWYCNNFCVYPDEDKIFSYDTAIKKIVSSNKEIKEWEARVGDYEIYDTYFMVWDPAFWCNISALLLCAFKNWKLDILDEVELEWDPTQQIDKIRFIENKLLNLGKVIKIIDSKGIGSTVLHICKMSGMKFDWMVENDWQSKKWTQVKGTKIIRVKKNDTVQLLQEHLEEGLINFDINLEETFKQFDHFKKKEKSWTKATYYSGKSGTKKQDDFISCILMVNLICFEVMWYKKISAARMIRESRWARKDTIEMHEERQRQARDSKMRKDFMEQHRKYKAFQQRFGA